MTRLPRTLMDKLWDGHEIMRCADGSSLLWVDRHLVHEGSHHAFGKLAARDLPVARPDLTVGVADHYVATRQGADTPESLQMLDRLTRHCDAHGIDLYGPSDTRQGIVHVIGPEQGLTLPGLLVVCGDSHTSSHGALGALAFGLGATQVAHVLATQTVWAVRPKRMRLTIDGDLMPGVGAKDMALAWIGRLGGDGAQGCALEYAGSAVRGLSIESRLTLCNMSIEGGARFGIVAPDQVTVDYVQGRPSAPTGADWAAAQDHWATLQSDAEASFDVEQNLDASSIVPIVTWGTNPDQALPVTANVPDPTRAASWDQDRITEALDYMGLVPGRPLLGTPVDRIFIGSCTNGRIEDLRMAAAVLSGRRAKVPGMVSPGSAAVKAQAEAEGLDRIFMESGLDWVGAGCSMCVGMNGDRLTPGQRCASTTNRNFRGRQGPSGRTHLMSPVMAAAAAVTGSLTDARPMLKGRMS